MTPPNSNVDQIFTDTVNRAEKEREEHLQRGASQRTPGLGHFIEMEAVGVDDIDMKRRIYEYANTPSSICKLAQSFEIENASVSLKYYQRAAKMGSGDACLRLGELYRDSKNHRFEPVNQSPSEAVKWFERAAEHGREVKAFLELGKIANDGIVLYKKDGSHLLDNKEFDGCARAYPLTDGANIDFPDNAQAINYLERAGVEGRQLLAERFDVWAQKMDLNSSQNETTDPRAQKYAIKSLEYSAGDTNRLILTGYWEDRIGECARIALGMPRTEYIDRDTQRSEWNEYVAQCYEEGVGVQRDDSLSKEFRNLSLKSTQEMNALQHDTLPPLSPKYFCIDPLEHDTIDPTKTSAPSASRTKAVSDNQFTLER